MVTRIYANTHIINARAAIDRGDLRAADIEIARLCGYRVVAVDADYEIVAPPHAQPHHPIHMDVLPLPRYTSRIDGAALLWFAAPGIPSDSVEPLEIVEAFLSYVERMTDGC